MFTLKAFRAGSAVPGLKGVSSNFKLLRSVEVRNARPLLAHGAVLCRQSEAQL